MSRQTPPDHRDPKATAGLTERRRKRGLPVGDEGLPERPKSLCPECREQPALNGGRCFECRGKSML